MRGKVASRQRCPNCGPTQYTLEGHDRRKQLICDKCRRFAAGLLEIVLWWDGRTLRITHDQHGRRFVDYIHAERALGLINNQIEDRSFSPDFWTSKKENRLLWENYLREYLTAEEARLLPERPATLSKKKSMARHFAWFNNKNIRDIRTYHVKKFASLPCIKLALEPKTLADLMGELRHVLLYARSNEDISQVPEVPPVSVPEKPIRWMNPEQQFMVLEKIPEDHRPIFQFLMTYGCRVSEGCALCWDMVDRGNGTFSLGRTFSRRQLVDRPKTKRHNVLPISGAFAEYLDAVPPGIGKAPLFQNPEADLSRNPQRFYVPDFLNNLWSRAVAVAGLEPIPLMNATRHSVGMQGVNLYGWNLEAVRRILGHTSTAHTRKYAQAETELVKSLLENKIKAISSQPKGAKARSKKS